MSSPTDNGPQNQIKTAAHDHAGFRAFAARHGQSIHQLTMRMSVASLRNVEAEMKAKDLAEAPTVKTKEQIEKEEREKKQGSAAGEKGKKRKKMKEWTSVWNRQFRPLPEAKAVSLFADVVGDAFILSVATGLLLFEYWRSSQKPDANLERIRELDARLEEMREREEEAGRREEEQRRRVGLMEEALRGLKDPKSKKPLLPSLQAEEAPPSPTP